MTAELACRLADEGLPVCAIARSLRTASDTIRDILKVALEDGVIFEYPREDWPPNTPRSRRSSMLAGILGDDERLRLACGRYFGTTKQQSLVLATLLKRSEVTKVQFHQVIEQHRIGADEETNIKLVDVIICILRRKLRKHDYDIETMWGRGYFMHPAQRHRIAAVLETFMQQADDPALASEVAA